MGFLLLLFPDAALALPRGFSRGGASPSAPTSSSAARAAAPPPCAAILRRGVASSSSSRRCRPRVVVSYRLSAGAGGGALAPNGSAPSANGFYTVADFMTRREDLRVVKPTTTVDEALEILVENRITGFPVIDDDWKLVGVVSDYDLLALDSISGSGRSDAGLFPEVDNTWKTFNLIQKLLTKTNGKVVGDVMTSAPLVICETTNLEDAARLLLETKYRRLPVVNGAGELVGLITRGNVVRAALQIKRKLEERTQS